METTMVKVENVQPGDRLYYGPYRLKVEEVEEHVTVVFIWARIVNDDLKHTIFLRENRGHTVEKVIA